jgi:hypothetical protein
VKATGTCTHGSFTPGWRVRDRQSCVGRPAHSVRVCLGC